MEVRGCKSSKVLKLSPLLALLIICQTAGYSLAAEVTGKIDRLAFLKGTWQGKTESGSFVEEYWSAPHGDGIIGNCRFVKNGKTTFLELLAIVEIPGGIVLRMRHFNESLQGWDEKDEAGDCLLTRCTDNEAVFDNGKVDHRVRVIYKKTGASSLSTVVEDTKNGKTSTFPFEYSRAETTTN